MRLDASYEGGNLAIVDASDSTRIRLALRPDTHAPFMQAFAFRALEARGVPLGFTIVNAAEATFPAAWRQYATYASYGRDEWFRVPTTYDGKTLAFGMVPEHDEIAFAYTPPYPRGRREALHARVARTPGCRIDVVGKSVEGRDLTHMVIGDAGHRTLVVAARQHPGEAMAEWFIEAFVERLLDEHDRVAGVFQETCTVHVFGCMNPDGVAHGNLRANARGEDLNRAWLEPSAERSPEILHVRAAIEHVGCDAFLDVHGDERIPHGFVKGCEGNPGFTPRLLRLEQKLQSALVSLCPDDIQAREGYPEDTPSPDNLLLGANWVSQTFDCLAMTLEMPFKDELDNPQRTGWSPDRSRNLGACSLTALRACLDDLR